jgi:hypothetical protein
MADKEVESAAKLLQLEVPEPCREGVAANVALLATHARILDQWREEEGEP